MVCNQTCLEGGGMVKSKALKQPYPEQTHVHTRLTAKSSHESLKKQMALNFT